MDISKPYKSLSDSASPLKPDYVVEQVKWYEDPIYIKMCEKAEEIQLYEGDRSSDSVVVCSACLTRWGNCREHCETVWTNMDGLGISPAFRVIDVEHRAIWLPDQAQLQEMVNDNINYTIKLQGFGRIFDLEDNQNIKATSWEQLWLAFHMNEEYSKVWDGESWIKEE